MNDTLFNVINDPSQCRVAICVEHIKPDWNIFRQTLKKLQVEHQTRIFVVTILMHLCLRTYAGNALPRKPSFSEKMSNNRINAFFYPPNEKQSIFMK